MAGAVLQSDEQLRVGPKANAELAAYFENGAEIRRLGPGLRRKGMTVVLGDEIASAGSSASGDGRRCGPPHTDDES